LSHSCTGREGHINSCTCMYVNVSGATTLRAARHVVYENRFLGVALNRNGNARVRHVVTAMIFPWSRVAGCRDVFTDVPRFRSFAHVLRVETRRSVQTRYIRVLFPTFITRANTADSDRRRQRIARTTVPVGRSNE